MLKSKWVRARPDVLKRLTGLTLGQFTRLALEFERLRFEGHGIARSVPRVRAIGGGRRGVLATCHDQALFILVYFRHYPTQEFAGILFGLSQPQVCDRVAHLSKYLFAALGHEMALPKRPPDRGDFLISHVPGLRYIIDGCERPRTRPVHEPTQTDYYSGKKKQHCVKNNIIINESTKQIIALGRTHPGRDHDKSMADTDAYRFPEGSCLTQDTGFQGLHPPGAYVRQPVKKPKGKELDSWTKFSNRTISMERVSVEHAIRGVKICRIAKDIYRNRRKGFDDYVMEIASGIYNFKMTA